MAKQTINIGASPNDGTGTPLRTAFDYCNLNFTELYTATGPSGNNIVVPGNATITGDLTVDTSTLKVDSANNRVIVGHTSGSSAFQVTNAGAAGLEIQPTGFSSAPLIVSYNRSGSAYTQLTLDGSTIVHALSGSEAMRLNANGLGIGTASPGAKLHVEGAAGSGGGDISIRLLDSTTTNTLQLIRTGATYSYGGIGGNEGALFSANTLTLCADGSNIIKFATNGSERVRIDASGNVGIGVTPSAWGTGLKVLQVGARGYGSFFDFNNDVVAVTANLFWTGSTYSRISASSKYAVAYYQDIGSGAHQWLSSSAAGTNGVTPTMNTNMTLDASGNLLVGKTASSSTVVGAELRPSGAIISTLAASTNADFALYTYSTGAGAARFYVGMSGTVFATNTTISAISDQRLKENVQDIDVGLGAILALKPRKFDWKEGKGKDIKGDRGFIAQEFETVFPQLVDEWADPAPEGEAPYKSVRQDLIPVLVKAIQELTARVQTLEAK